MIKLDSIKISFCTLYRFFQSFTFVFFYITFIKFKHFEKGKINAPII